MIYKSYGLVVVASMILVGCASRIPVIETGGYYFDFEGKTYRIDSVNPESMVGYNILALKEEEQNVVVGIDKDQNGSLDEVVAGNVSLQKAREIYLAGIADGEKQGRVKSETMTQEYRMVVDQYTYSLITYKLAVGEIFNKLIITNNYFNREEAVLLDQGADGRLDKIEIGERDLEHYQSIYAQVIERGLTYGRVKKSNGTFQVVP